MKIPNSHAIITGASSGIGRAIALELASRGARLTLASRNHDRLEETAELCRNLGTDAQAVRTDVTLVNECARLVERAESGLGETDLLVSAAGFGILGPARATTAVTINDMMQTNFLGAVRCTRLLLPSMTTRGRGGLVYISSILGIMGTGGMAGYAASKFALNGWAEALRDEIIDLGIFVSLVCPGTTETAFFERADRNSIPDAAALLPTLSPEEVARATARAIEKESWRIILPVQARLFMRFSEIAPRTAHFLMRKVSRYFARRRQF